MSGTLVVLLGAGASFDCVLPGSRTVPALKPPLSTDLFNPRFEDILVKYPGAEVLAAEIRSWMEQGLTLEQALKRLEQDPKVVHFFRQIPMYLQNVLGEVSEGYITRGANAYHQLVVQIARVVPECFETVLFLSLNYDTYLEEALTRFYRCQFREPDDYLRTEDRWAFVKLHGSVTWVYPMDDNEFLEVFYGRAATPPEDAIVIVASYRERVVGNLRAYPALAVPLDGKSGFVCPPALVKASVGWLENATAALVVGCSVMDQDVLDLLGHIGQLDRINIVNGSTERGAQTWNRLQKHRAFREPARLVANHVFSGGFAEYVSGTGLTSFLGA